MIFTLFARNNHPQIDPALYEHAFAYVIENGFIARTFGFINESEIRMGPSCWQPHTRPTFESLTAWVSETFRDNTPRISNYVPGTIYKRIFRPTLENFDWSRMIDINKVEQSFVALRILLDKLLLLFRTIEPSDQNSDAYGHSVRELLLLACMEVESSWIAVLTESGYHGTGRLNTNDYVKLKNAMFLHTYRLSLRSYSTLQPFSPFERWDAMNPTQSLMWYEAYNRTKHDRENHLDMATLQHCVHAVGAAVILFYSQFGFSLSCEDRKRATIESIFKISTSFGQYPDCCYLPAESVDYQGMPSAPRPFRLVDCPF